MPFTWFVSTAYRRHSSCTSQATQILLALAICAAAGPDSPAGKKSEASWALQAARSRQSISPVRPGSSEATVEPVRAIVPESPRIANGLSLIHLILNGFSDNIK